MHSTQRSRCCHCAHLHKHSSSSGINRLTKRTNNSTSSNTSITARQPTRQYRVISTGANSTGANKDHGMACAVQRGAKPCVAIVDRVMTTERVRARLLIPLRNGTRVARAVLMDAGGIAAAQQDLRARRYPARVRFCG